MILATQLLLRLSHDEMLLFRIEIGLMGFFLSLTLLYFQRLDRRRAACAVSSWDAIVTRSLAFPHEQCNLV